MDLKILKYCLNSSNTIGGNAKTLVAFPPKLGTTEVCIDLLDNICMDILIRTLKASEITITFKETYRNTTDLNIRDLLTIYLKHHIGEGVFYILYPEYGANYKLHYHGIIWGGSSRVYSSIKRKLSKDIGRNTLRMISFPDSYWKYLIKERKDIEHIETLIIFKV